MLILMDDRPITVADLRAELSLYPDDALVAVLVPDTLGARVLQVVAIGHSDVAPDDILSAHLPLVTERLPQR